MERQHIVGQLEVDREVGVLAERFVVAAAFAQVISHYRQELLVGFYNGVVDRDVHGRTLGVLRGMAIPMRAADFIPRVLAGRVSDRAICRVSRGFIG